MVLLGVMILIHELGHYWACLAVGVRVQTFSIGFGPRLFGFRRGETDFRISAIPFGGYVRMFGEQPGDEAAADPNSFQAKSRWRRAIVIIAGPLMNIVLAVGIMTGIFMNEFPKQVTVTNPIIGKVIPGSPAEKAGVHDGDRIVQIGGIANPNWQDIQAKEALNADRPLPVTIEREGKRLSLTVIPQRDKEEGIGIAGWVGESDVVISQLTSGLNAVKAGLKPGDLLVSANGQQIRSTVKLQEVIQNSQSNPVDLIISRDGHLKRFSVTPIKNGDTDGQWRIGVALSPKMTLVQLPFGEALVESAQFNRRNATLIFQVLESIVERRISATTLEGPIQIAQRSREAAKEGATSFLGLMAIVSLNLAIFNLLPIPILDGGVLMLLLIEMVIRRDMSLQIKEAVFKVGFVFLMMIVVFVLYNDISKMFSRG